MERVTRLPATGSIEVDPAQSAAILGLNLDGARRPLVFARIWREDEIQGYRDLAAALGADQPIYLVAPPAAANALDYKATVQDWAHHVGAELRSLKLGGPFLLGGWSFGGVIALELARELEATGECVERVLMIDSWLPRRHSKTPRSLPRKFVDLYDAWRVREPGDRWGAVRGPILWRFDGLKRRAIRIFGSKREEPSNDKSAETIHDPLRRSVWVAYLKYEARPTTTPVTLFWCEDSRSDWGDSSLGWAPWLRGPFHGIPIPGGHFTVWKHVPVLREHLEELTRSR